MTTKPNRSADPFCTKDPAQLMPASALGATSRGLFALVLIGALSLAACTKDSRPPSLGEPISIEQAGGGATQLIDSGSLLPTAATESFTVAHDGENKLYIHVLRGKAKKAGKLSSEGWWSVEGLSTPASGRAQAFVTFDLDAKGDLKLSARQDAVKLKCARMTAATEGLKPSPLTEPDDDEESEDEPE